MISVAPTEAEKLSLLSVAETVLDKIREESGKIDGRIKPVLLGSASRDTWLANEKDLDVFLMFPLEYEKEQMEEVVTGIGKKVLNGVTRRYAEHPYVRGKYREFDVEIVPCYAVDSPQNMKSAVDRTPFHDAFIREHIGGKENDVRLLKQFLRGIGCYGAEAKVEGFSGYLCELLLIKYGSFEGVLKAARKWQRGQIICTYGRPNLGKIKKFTEPLIFIDPVDDNRNVASALSSTKLSEFIFAATRYLEDPREAFFFPEKRKADMAEIIHKFEERGSYALAIVFDMPDLVDDILYPQLKRATGAIRKLLSRSEFAVVGTDFFVGRRSCIFIELGEINIPKIRLHKGPKVNTVHESRFLSKYRDFDEKLTEPFIMEDRWSIFLKRKYTNAKVFLSDFLSQAHLEKKGIPKYVAKGIEEGYVILEGKDTILAEFAEDLLEYFDPRFPWEVKGKRKP